MTYPKALFPTALFVFMLALSTGCGLTDTRSDSAGEYVEDAVVTTRINAAIFDNSELRNSDVDVETVNGEVRLSGTLDSEEEVETLVELVEEVDGVRSIQNDVEVE